MLGTLRRNFVLSLLGLIFLMCAQYSYGQENQKITLKTYLSQLEQQYSIKFSFIDEDLEGIDITIPDSEELSAILKALEVQTQIQIEGLNDRYYSLVKSDLVDVCGKVLDNFAKNTIPGATIEVLGSENAIITDMDGSFAMKNVPRESSLRIRYLGYTTKIISAEDLAGCPTILLAQKYEKLNEVVVYEFLTQGIVKQEDASITLNTAALGILPGLIEPDILQTVQSLPGIKSIDETVSDINVRGGTNDQNLILWNGIKMYQSGHFFGLISAFNPYLTDKVTVYKNGTPTQYGDGVSSVISMETKNEIDGIFSGGAGINFISGDVYGQIPIRGDMAFQFSGRRSTTDFLNTPTYSKFFDRAFQDSQVRNQFNQSIDENFERNETFFFYDFSAKFLYDFHPDHKLRVNFIGIDNILKYTETNVNTGETTQSLLDQTNISVGAQLTSRWTDRFSSHVNTYYTIYALDSRGLSANQAQELRQNNRVIEDALKIDTNYKLSDTFNWSNGYQFIETAITNLTKVSLPFFEQKTTGVIRIHAPYSEIHFKSSNDRLIGSAGVRANYMVNPSSVGASFKKLIIEPRLNLNFRVANYLRAQLLGEFKSQSTNQVIDLEQNFLGIEKRRWILSDDNQLPITQSKQGSFGLNYAKKAFYMSLDAFYKQVDGISVRTQGFQNEEQFNGEIGSYEVKGLEFLVNQKGENYSTWLSYTYNKNDYTFEDIDPNTFPNNLDVRHTLTLAGTYTLNDLKLSAGINYRTGKPVTDPLEGDNALDTSVFPIRINYQPPNSSRLPDYFRADASAVYHFQMSREIKANVGVSLLNVTNKKNIINRYYRLSDSDAIETVENISLGITPNVSFRVNF